jgi:hypothetical protein
MQRDIKINIVYFMKLLKIAALCLISLSLASCSTRHIYSEPSSDTGNVASLTGTRSGGLFDWEDTSIHSIDSKEIIRIFNTGVNVTPGEHLVTISAKYNRGLLSSGVSQAVVDVQAHFAPGRSYLAKMTVIGSQIRAWIEDKNTGQISSSVGQSTWHKQINNTVYIHQTVRKRS